jgi:hypothetical protein
MSALLGRASQGNKIMLDRVQITRLEGSIPSWQMHDLKVFSSQRRFALRASEEQIKEAVNLKPSQQMLIDLYPVGIIDSDLPSNPRILVHANSSWQDLSGVCRF